MASDDLAVMKPGTARVLVASLVGTSVEFYDFYIYATATSLVFGPLFFPVSSKSAQLLAAYATFGLAFLARPVGGIIFGHFGDRVGRKSTLVASLLLMGISTFAVALLPTYENAGWLAPALLCVLRLGQGIGLGGEWSGAALLAVENAPCGWHGRFGSVPQLGAPIGFIAANGLFLVLGAWLTPAQFIAWGWRLPFLASAALVALGLWVRLKLTETPEFAATMAAHQQAAVPIVEVLGGQLLRTIAGILGVIACFAVYYIATAFALGYGTTALGFARQSLLEMQILAILFMGLGIGIAGWASDRFGAKAVLLFGCLLTIAAGACFAPLFGGGSLTNAFLFLCFALLTMGFVYGPLGAWLTGLYPVRLRYTASSLAFNVGGIIGGGMTPAVAKLLADRGGLSLVGIYLMTAAVLSAIGIALVRGPARDHR